MTQPQYQARIAVHPRSVKGRFRTLKTAILLLAYAVYFLLPWLRWDRENAPDQAVLFDLAGRKFYVFDLVVYAQDIFWLAGLLVIFALLLFFVTGLAGRVWCGYFCFQTLWTDLYMFVERWIQGDRNARMKLARAPWRADKILRLGATWLAWLLIAVTTGVTFVLYWGDAPVLLRQMLTGEAPFAAYATVGFLTLTTFVMAGLAREQVCTYMCPYARFQGVMFDENTLIVAYDEQRGERDKGRQKPRKGLMNREARIAQGVGDCIDCGYCFQVCPVGIDIRDGLQYQCISCALCIDACDTIMDSIGHPRGLVRYTSENALAGKPTRLLNPKNLGYGAALAVTIGALVWSVAHRADVELAVYQIRQPLAVSLSDGRVQNRYRIKINNKTERRLTYRLGQEGLEPEAEIDAGRFRQFTLEPEQMLPLQVKVRRDPRHVRQVRESFAFVLEPVGQGEAPVVRHATQFYTPPAQVRGDAHAG